MTKKHITDLTPGGLIQQRMTEKGWSQRDLALVLGRPLQAVNEIVVGKKAITPATAKELSAALGGPVKFWMYLEANYRLKRETANVDDIRARAALMQHVPWQELVRRGWIDHHQSSTVLKGRVEKFLGVRRTGQIQGLAGALRKSSTYGPATIAELAWSRRVMDLAKGQKVGRFRPAQFEQCFSELKSLVIDESKIDEVPRVLSRHGIRLVVVKHLTKTNIDGGAFWLRERSMPAIGLSLRYGRIDYFWFTLFHELAHIKNEDGASCDSEIFGVRHDLPPEEMRANREAAAALVDPAAMGDFIAASGRPSRLSIERFAKQQKTHPGIVLGQLQHRGVLSYAMHRDLLVGIRDRLIPHVKCDGWESE